MYKPAQLLAKNFPKIDRISKGVATSIKSIDLTAKSYQNGAALASKLTKYLDELAALNGEVLRGTTRAGIKTAVDTGKLVGRELVVAIEPGAASLAQRAAIKEVVKSAEAKGVTVIVKTVR